MPENAAAGHPIRVATGEMGEPMPFAAGPRTRRFGRLPVRIAFAHGVRARFAPRKSRPGRWPFGTAGISGMRPPQSSGGPSGASTGPSCPGRRRCVASRLPRKIAPSCWNGDMKRDGRLRRSGDSVRGGAFGSVDGFPFRIKSIPKAPIRDRRGRVLPHGKFEKMRIPDPGPPGAGGQGDDVELAGHQAFGTAMRTGCGQYVRDELRRLRGFPVAEPFPSLGRRDT